MEIADLVLKLRDKLVSVVGAGSTTDHQSQPDATCDAAVSNRKCAFQIKARQQQLQLKHGVLEKLDNFIDSTVSSLPEDLQAVLRTH